MSYAIELTSEAAADFARLPLHVALLLEKERKKLADDPVRLSRPSRFPYTQRAQMFVCEIPFEGVQYFLHVLFQYGQDEQSLPITAVAVQKI